MQKLNLALSLAAGLLGGFLSRNLTLPTAHAQEPHQKELKAESFILVDGADRTVGTFTFEPNFATPRIPRIVLRDPSGRVLWSAGGSPIRPLTDR